MTVVAANRIGSVLVVLFLVVLSAISYSPIPHGKVSITDKPRELDRSIMTRPLKVIQAGGGRRSVTLERLVAQHGALLVNFWATWCPACIDELPSLSQLGQSAISSGLFPVVAVSVDESAQDVLALFDTLRLRSVFLVLHDPHGEVAREFGTTKFPESFWVVGGGAVVHRWVGPQQWLSAGVVSQIKTLLVSRKTR